MNRTQALALAAIAFAIAGCNREPQDQPPAPTPPDNTGTNTRDRSDATQTPMDQGLNETDTRITAEVRKAIMDDSSMSMNAQNCKIITASGVVTLRGPVASQAEKDSIEAKARAVAGVTNVVNELEVTNG
jgi:hyperosmotically inducible protein